MTGLARLAFAPLDGSSEASAVPAGAVGRRPVLVDLSASAAPNQEPTGTTPAREEPGPGLAGSNVPELRFTASELEAAVSAARDAVAAEVERRVRADVTAEVEGRLERQLAEAVERCAAELASLVAAAEASGRVEPDAQLALAMARAIVPHALEQAPLADIEAMLVDLLRGLGSEPRLELRLAPDLLEPGRRIALQVAERVGFAGQVVVAAEPGLKPGDARVLWQHGRAERTIERVIADLESMLAGFGGAPDADSQGPDGLALDDLEAAGATP